MTESQPGLWSDSPNAPKVPYDTYFYEKTWFAGVLVSSIFYGAHKITWHGRPPIYSTYSRDRRRGVLPVYSRAV